MTDTQWENWLRRSASAERCLLIQLSHSGGVIHVASRPYTSRPTDALPNTPFRSCLTESFEINDSDEMTLGDIEITWPEKVFVLRQNHWRGYPYTVWMGGVNWPMADFRVIASGFIESIQRTSQYRLKFWLAGPDFALSRPLAATLNGSVTETCLAITQQCGLAAPVFDFFSAEQLASTITLSNDNDISCVDALNEIAETLGGIVNTDKDGVVHIVYLDHYREADHLLVDDDWVSGSLEELSELRALSAMTLSYQSGEETATLEATSPSIPYPAGWVETLSVSTHFNNTADAQRRLDELSAWRFSRRIAYAVDVLMRGVDFNRGDRVRLLSKTWGLDVTTTILNAVRRPDLNRFELELIS